VNIEKLGCRSLYCLTLIIDLEVTLTDGVDELIRGEQAFEEMYDSASSSGTQS